MYRLALTLSALGFLLPTLHAADIDFTEDFALAKDRALALTKLIPGTEDFYYYHCLHYQNIGEFDKASLLFAPWFERFKQTPRLTEMQTRQALLTYAKNPQQSLDYFKNRLGLVFNHERTHRVFRRTCRPRSIRNR